MQSGPSCFIIGEGHIAIRCGEILLSNGYDIRGVVTPERALHSWAEEKRIACAGPQMEFAEFLKRESFDYLFSIFNVRILPDAVLGLPREGAINYHDALLPRYAGLHAPSWALLNGERRHGITWHRMVAEVDAGDILKRREVEIAPGDTSLSLNQRCFDAAAEAFEELIVDLRKGSWMAVPQDLRRRSYYPKELRPDAACLIDWRQSAEQIDRLVRALDFGPFHNPLGTPKIAVNGGFLAISKARIVSTNRTVAPGEVMECDGEKVIVGAGTHAIELTGLRTLEGKSVSVEPHPGDQGLRPGDNVDEFGTQDRAEIHDINTRCCRHDEFWARRLEASQSSLARESITQARVPALAASRKCWCLPPEAGPWLAQQADENKGEIILACFAGYLARLGGEQHLDLGWRVEDGRVRKWSGLFAATVPIRLQVDVCSSTKILIEDTRSELKEVRRRLSFCRDIYLRHPKLRDREFRPRITLQISTTTAVPGISVDGFVFSISPTGDEGELLYDPGSHDEAADRVLRHFNGFLKGLAGNSDHALGQISFVPEEDRAPLLALCQGPSVQHGNAASVLNCFHEQVVQRPHAAAVEFNGETLSYLELNRRANCLAHRLLDAGIQAEDRVGLFMNRSVEMIVALLAVMKAGGAYLPLDPTLPGERVLFMVRHAKPRLVLSREHLRPQLPLHDVEVLNIDGEFAIRNHNPVRSIEPGTASYVLYTSGSTGTPKGVIIEHGALYNYVSAAAQHFEISARDKILQFASFSFDASAEEIWTCLTRGATLVLRTPEMMDSAAKFLECCAAWKITVLDLPTAYWNHLVDEMEQDAIPLPHAVRLVIIGGERANSATLNKWRNLPSAQRVRLINTYGPTEATVVSTWCDLHPSGASEIPLSIGRPIPNASVYVLDAFLQPLPVGAVGEICIGGLGVARGYVDMPTLTSEKFVAVTLDGGLSERLFRTGDKGRYLPDGNLEFLGRCDRQVKVRGFRVEPEEVEAALSRNPEVERNAVIAIEDPRGAVALHAFLVGRHAGACFPDAVRAWLRQRLPDYMIPGSFTLVHALPLTTNGKLDCDKLMLLARAPVEGVLHQKPRTEIERHVAEIWENLLQLRSIGIHQNFFEVGGHSLLAVTLTARVNRQFGTNIALRWVFDNPTIAGLASQIEIFSEAAAAFSPLPQTAEELELADLWDGARESGRSGLHDDFFAAGGAATGAERLVETLSHHYGVAITQRTLMDCPTISRMSEYLRKVRGRRAATWWRKLAPAGTSERVVALRAAGASPPLFICPGGWMGDSELLVFAQLIPYLPRDIPVYGLKQDLAVASNRTGRTIAAMARNFLREMRKIQPEGPYRLLGECISTVIVLEIAHQLRAVGESIQHLLLLDPRVIDIRQLRQQNIYQTLPPKIARYYGVLAKAKLRALPIPWIILGPEDAGSLRRRVEQLMGFSEQKMVCVQVPGDHHTYLREHGRALAIAITAQVTVQPPSTTEA